MIVHIATKTSTATIVPTEDKYLPPDRRAGTAIHMNAPGNPAILALQL